MNAEELNQLARDAARHTDERLTGKISMLTRFSGNDISACLQESQIDPRELVDVLQILSAAARDNEQAAASISKINNGVRAIVAIASRLV